MLTLRRALAAVAALYVIAFVACAAIRLTFGFELSWMESGMQAMTARLAAHQSIYAAPSPSYVPFVYPPLYYVTAHVLATAIPGLGTLAAMRVVSVLSTLGTVALVLVVLARHGVRAAPRALLAALVLAFYGRFQFWHDTSRVDSLFVLLVFGATALLVEGRRARSAIAAGVVAGLAVLTKQPALPLVAGTCLLVAAAERRPARALAAVGVAAATVLALLAAMGELHPWLYFYTLTVPATHPLVPRYLASGVGFVLLTMPLLLWAAARALRRPRPPRAATSTPADATTTATADAGSESAGVRTWALAFALTAATMIALRLKEGANVNFFMPLVPIGVVVCGPLVARFGRPQQALLLAQFLILAYDPLRAVPTAADWEAGFDLVHMLRRIPGDVFLPQFPGYLARAGKRPVAHDVAVCDLERARPDLTATIDADLRGGAYAAALPWPADDRQAPPCHARVPRANYRPDEPLPAGGAFFDREHASRVAGISRYRQAPGGPGEGGGHAAGGKEGDIWVDPPVGWRETGRDEVHGVERDPARVSVGAGGGGRSPGSARAAGPGG